MCSLPVALERSACITGYISRTNSQILRVSHNTDTSQMINSKAASTVLYSGSLFRLPETDSASGRPARRPRKSSRISRASSYTPGGNAQPRQRDHRISAPVLEKRKARQNGLFAGGISPGDELDPRFWPEEPRQSLTEIRPFPPDCRRYALNCARRGLSETLPKPAPGCRPASSRPLSPRLHRSAQILMACALATPCMLSFRRRHPGGNNRYFRPPPGNPPSVPVGLKMQTKSRCSSP